MSQRNKAVKRAAFTDEVDIQKLDETTYGSIKPNPDLDTGRMIGKPVDIMSVWADRQQPRRAVPGLIRSNWDGNPAQVADLLSHWQTVAEQKAGTTIPVMDILKGRGGIESETSHPHFDEFMALLTLAQSIQRDGLVNPISIIRRGSSYVIESGERRWLAYHLLNHLVDKTYGKIPAIESKSSESVWRQAHENMQRSDLNAIEKARQLALLIMDLRGGQTNYNGYEDVVVGCDRIFYAQVANGNHHPIPKGMSERIQSAMRLKRNTIAEYRSLLRLTDDNEVDGVNDILWLRADEEDWAFRALVDFSRLPLDTLRAIVLQRSFTLEDLRVAALRFGVPNISSGSHNSDGDDTKATAIAKELLTVGTVIKRDMGDYWLIEEVHYGGEAFICRTPAGYRLQVPYHKIVAIANDKLDLFKPPSKAPTPDPALDERGEQNAPTRWEPFGMAHGTPALQVGMLVESIVGSTKDERFVVIGIASDMVVVRKYKDTLAARFEPGQLVEVKSPYPPIRKDDLVVGAWIHDNEYRRWQIKRVNKDSHPRWLSVDDDGVARSISHYAVWRILDAADVVIDDDMLTDDTAAFPAFDETTLDVIDGIAILAGLLDTPGVDALADLHLLDKLRLQRVLIEGGIAAVEEMVKGYGRATQEVMNAIQQRINDHLQQVLIVALEMAKKD